MRERYERQNLDRGWTWERTARLCQILRVTPAELAACFQISVETMKSYREQKRVSPSDSVHFAQLEAAYLKVLHGWDVKPVVPAECLQGMDNEG